MKIPKAAGILLVFLCGVSAVTESRARQASRPAQPSPAQLASKVENYLRNLYAWGPEYQLKVGPAKPGPVARFYEIPVRVSYQGQNQDGVVYATEDGRYLVRGEFDDMTAEPFAETRSKLRIQNSPSVGPASAAVTVVEFSDFQCPHCRELSRTLQEIIPKYPQVRFVFKNFPISQIHAWAESAARAAQCIHRLAPQSFWRFSEEIFEQQDLLSAENVWDKTADLAAQSGIPKDEFRTCISAPETAEAVQADLAEGRSLRIDSTPMVFVNGRKLVGGDKALLEQSINYELTKLPKPKGH